MSDIKRGWDVLPKERKTALIKQVIAYFKTERGEDLGVIAAEDILDFFLEAMGKDIYNQALYESKIIIQENFESLEIELDVLSKK